MYTYPHVHAHKYLLVKLDIGEPFAFLCFSILYNRNIIYVPKFLEMISQHLVSHGFRYNTKQS